MDELLVEILIMSLVLASGDASLSRTALLSTC